jgi:hypothetical protein
MTVTLNRRRFGDRRILGIYVSYGNDSVFYPPHLGLNAPNSLTGRVRIILAEPTPSDLAAITEYLLAH